jgi:hypothetical protein
VALGAAELRAAVPAAITDYLAWKRALLSQRAPKSAKDLFISNAFVRLGVGFEGAWGLGSTGGDPADPNDDNLDLTFSLTGSSNGLALEVDGVLHVLDESLPEIVRADDGSCVNATWGVEGMVLRARYELVDCGSGRADTAKVTYTVTNPAPAASGGDRSVSLKVGLDIDVGNAYARLVTPAGSVAVETGFGQTANGTTYPLAVPDFWQGFQRDSLADPGLIAQGTFAGGGASPPDQVIIGQWPAVSAGSSFDHVPSGAGYGDSAVALWWFNRSLPPETSVSFVILYGMGQMIRSGSDLAVGLSSPASLGSAGSAFEPNPFSVMVQVQNLGTENLLDLPVTITLPSGLTVAAGGATSQSVAALSAGARAVVSFLLAADPECAGQTLVYSVAAGSGLSPVTIEKSVELPVAADTHTVTFRPGAHGALAGGTPAVAVQVAHGDPAPLPPAVNPAPGWEFAGWSLPLPATITAVLEVTAQYRRLTCTLSYLAGPNGSLTGPTPQTLDYGGSGVAVTAVAAYGYVFQRWSDGSAANPRLDTGVTVDQTCTAQFRAAGRAPPDGEFVAVEDTATHRLWDLSGIYSTNMAGKPLLLAVIHDTRGRLTGTAAMQIETAKMAETVRMPIRGSVSGAKGALVATMAMQGATAAKAVRISLLLKLTLNAPARQLAGSAAGSIKTAVGTAAVSELVTLDLPASMDGTWTLLLDLTPGGRAVTGDATLGLAGGGAAYPLAINGRIVGQKVEASLAGNPADAAARGIRIRATIVPLEGGWALLEHLALTGYGQTLAP